ncbi:MAG: hypothetical protein B7Z37_01905 [Verrucomicrobia bacterium 12-59-8]|nr:MAG: hypothetical protein B7Z37_01905 [Verrucomicrobia bacterium 12-59-8]
MKTAASAGFLQLFSLEVVHQYLSGGPYGTFTLSPMGATEKVLQRFGWSAGQTDNTFTLYANPTRAAATLKPGPAVPLNAPDLCFAIAFRDPDFARYTDIPMQPGCVLAFAADSTSQKKKHPPVSVKATLSPADLTPVQTRQFQCPVAGGAAPGDLCIVRPGGEEVMPLPTPRGGKVTVDPSVLDLGLYHIIYKKKIIYRFIKLNNHFFLQSDFILSISVNLMMSVFQRYLVKPASQKRKPLNGPLCARLTLPARSTIWRYDVFNHQGADALDFEILPAAPASVSAPSAALPVFHPVKGMKGPGGETSVSFESASPIPLAARPTQRLKLMRKNLPLIDELPTPGLDFAAPPGASALRSSLLIYL